MKRLVFLLLTLGLAASLFAQNQFQYQPVSGTWREVGNRVYQNDAKAPLAKATIRAPQSGPMAYEFNVRYEDGIEDGHGGFGIHIYGDSVSNRASWGSGNSYLLWLNFDENPTTPGIRNGNPKNLTIYKGLSAQVYKSYSNSYMELLESINLDDLTYQFSLDDLKYPVPFKIEVNGNTGEVRVYDPMDPQLIDYYYFFIDKKFVPLKGNWVTVRTNSLSLSFQPGLY
ncbi:MAG: hypothetical protein LBQ88_21635 [Treponema sp.]|jgi:hypothetical protein|nr:hypothetical protein [Treponema sp.]